MNPIAYNSRLKTALEHKAERYVYVIGEGNKPCKIGHAASPYERLRAIQYGNPRQLTLWWFISVTKSSAVEREAHHILLKYRLRGEWFDVSGHTAIRAVEDAICKVGAMSGQLMNAIDTSDRLSLIPQVIPNHKKNWRASISMRRAIACDLFTKGESVVDISGRLATSERIIQSWISCVE